MTRNDFKVTWSKVKVKLLVFKKYGTLNIFCTPLLLCLKVAKISTVNAP